MSDHKPKRQAKEWVKSGDYLPDIMRDFHDQKDLFKTIHELVAVEKHEYAGNISWVAGQCYVIDIFLWWMAQRGYTLQKSRQPVEFRDLHDDVAKARQRQDNLMASFFSAAPSKGDAG